MAPRHPLRRRLDHWADQIADYVRRPSSFSRRKPRIPGELHRISRFESKHLKTRRDIVVYLPPGYENDVGRRYPVLYMHDGQNLFDPRTSFIKGQHWRVGETAGAMILAGVIAPLIVVGIENAGERRIDEYTPTRDAERDRGGQADHYGKMILTELKPRIDRDYRTLGDPAHTAVAGSSLGGLVSLHLGLKHPQAFGRLAVLSPSVWWDDRVILQTVESFHSETRPQIWLDVGTGEGDEALRSVRQLAETLRRKGWRDGQDLHYAEIPGAGHHEGAWAARIGEVLQFLFGR
jgi:predicted alpha/beta superfamily hydrolase